MKERSHHERPFNSPLECGLRLLFILAAAQGHPCDLQRLVSYDYLLVHSGDVPGGPRSLHPAVPFRGSELLVKRDALKVGLNQMFSKELINKNFDTLGITYRSNEMTSAFVDLMKNDYADYLRHRASWVIRNFQVMDDGELEHYMADNIGRWGAEFEHLSAIKNLEL